MLFENLSGCGAVQVAVWHLLAGALPEADQASHNAIRFLEEALTKEQESAKLYS